MATAAGAGAAGPPPAGGIGAGGAAAIGAVGGAINSYFDRKGQEAMYAQQTQQLREQIAYQRKVMEEQAVLRQQEIERQQIMARAQGSAFADSLGQFRDVQGDLGAKTNNIADVFRAVLARQAPASTAPAGGGPTEAYEAAMRNEQGASVRGDADRLAAVQAFGALMNDKGRSLTENDQFAALLRNFGSGSQQASQAEIAAREGRLYQPQVMAPQPSMMGDLFVGLANAGAAYANRPAAPVSPYALDVPERPALGLKATGYTGLQPSMPAGLGIRTR